MWLGPSPSRRVRCNLWPFEPFEPFEPFDVRRQLAILDSPLDRRHHFSSVFGVGCKA